MKKQWYLFYNQEGSEKVAQLARHILWIHQEELNYCNEREFGDPLRTGKVGRK